MGTSRTECRKSSSAELIWWMAEWRTVVRLRNFVWMFDEHTPEVDEEELSF